MTLTGGQRKAHTTYAERNRRVRGKFTSIMLEKTLWERFLDTVEPHLPEHLHWNEICVSFEPFLHAIKAGI